MQASEAREAAGIVAALGRQRHRGLAGCQPGKELFEAAEQVRARGRVRVAMCAATERDRGIGGAPKWYASGLGRSGQRARTRQRE